MPINFITIVRTLKFTNARNKNGGYSNKRNKIIKMEIRYALIVIQKIVFCNTLILVLCELPTCDTKAASSSNHAVIQSLLLRYIPKNCCFYF